MGRHHCRAGRLDHQRVREDVQFAWIDSWPLRPAGLCRIPNCSGEVVLAGVTFQDFLGPNMAGQPTSSTRSVGMQQRRCVPGIAGIKACYGRHTIRPGSLTFRAGSVVGYRFFLLHRRFCWASSHLMRLLRAWCFFVRFCRTFPTIHSGRRMLCDTIRHGMTKRGSQCWC